MHLQRRQIERNRDDVSGAGVDEVLDQPAHAYVTVNA